MIPLLHDLATSGWECPLWLAVVAFAASVVLGASVGVEVMHEKVKQANATRDEAVNTANAAGALCRQLYKELGRRPAGHIRDVPKQHTGAARVHGRWDRDRSDPQPRADHPTPRLDLARTWTAPVPPPPTDPEDRWLKPLTLGETTWLQGHDQDPVQWPPSFDTAHQALLRDPAPLDLQTVSA